MPNASKTSDLHQVKGDVPQVKRLRQINILLVQSNPADSLLTTEAFKSAGLIEGLHCVSDGEEALAYVLRKGRFAKTPPPEMIFLDLSQPRVSGLEVLKVIKSTPELMHIPIVVAAGADDPKFVRAVYELNGNCFIRKPGELAEFVRFIETCYEFWGNVVTLAPHSRRTFSRSTQSKADQSHKMARRAAAASHE